MLKHNLQKLNSGLSILTIPMDSLQSVTCMVLANTGSRYEDQGQFGIAHFLEHIVFKGTKKYPTAQILAEEIDSIGAEFNAFTSKEYTGFYVKAASRHLDLALDVLSEMLLRPNLLPEDIDREKGVILEEMNMYADMPQYHIANLFEQMAFKGSGLGHDIIGLKSDVLNINQDKFKKFLAKFYNLNNLILVLVGDKNILNNKNINNNFNKNISGKNKLFKHNLSDQILSKEKFLYEHKKTNQSHFVFGFPGIKRKSKDRYTLAILSTILGGNMSSRLFNEVREKRGLAYYVHTDIRQYHENGIFGASVGVDPNRVEEAIKVSISEFFKLVNQEQKITAQELKQAQEYTIGKMILKLEDSQDVAQFFGLKQLLFGEIESLDKIISKIRAVNLTDLQNLAQKIIKPQELRFAIIGDYNQDKLKNILNNLCKCKEPPS